MERKSSRLLAWVPVVAICVLGGCDKPPPLPPMLQTVQPDSHLKDGPRPFNDLLQQRFALGSPEAKLVEELRSEGLTPKTDLNAQTREFVFQRMGSSHDICRRDAGVTWSSDTTGGLTTLSGYYIAQCS